MLARPKEDPVTDMSNINLATYLNDHLSGSVLALELLEHLQSLPPDGELKVFLVKLENDIKADRVVLEAIMHGLQVREARHERWSPG